MGKGPGNEGVLRSPSGTVSSGDRWVPLTYEASVSAGGGVGGFGYVNVGPEMNFLVVGDRLRPLS